MLSKHVAEIDPAQSARFGRIMPRRYSKVSFVCLIPRVSEASVYKLARDEARSRNTLILPSLPRSCLRNHSWERLLIPPHAMLAIIIPPSVCSCPIATGLMYVGPNPSILASWIVNHSRLIGLVHS